MSKDEIRMARRGTDSAAGNAGKELKELKKMQNAGKDFQSGIVTITVGCGNMYTLICC